jgi:lysophospholipase L1-like esterase
VYIGINDAMYDEDSRSVAKRILEVLTLISGRTNQVVYLPIITSRFQAWGGEARLAYLSNIHRVVTIGLNTVPNVIQVTLSGLTADDFVWDGIHLSATGNQKLLNVVKKII